MTFFLIFAPEVRPGGWFAPEAAFGWFDIDIFGETGGGAAIGASSGSIGINTSISIGL